MQDIEQWIQNGLAYAFVGGPFALALLLGLLVPLILIGVGSATRRVGESSRLALLLGTAAVGTTLLTALSGRVLHSEVEIAMHPFLKFEDGEGGRWGSLASQVATILTLALAGAEWFRWLTGGNRLPEKARAIWLAAMTYFLISIVMSGLFGVFRNPRLNDLYSVIVLTAIALLGRGCTADMWRKLRWVLLLPSAASLVAVVVAPKLVLLPDYASLIPGLGKRLYGMADHANAIGMVAGVGLILEACPLVRRRPALLFVLCHGAVLLLAQSKTAWAGTFLALLFVRWTWMQDKVFKGDRWRTAMVLTIVACVVLASASLATAFGARSERWLRLLEGSGALTFTGRTEIWRITLEEFYKSPLLGFGPSLWDLQYRAERGMLQAGQAHNQFVHILGQAGLLGMGALLVYLGMMFRGALANWRQSQGLGFAVLLMLLVRCWSEAPLRMVNLIGWENWMHYVAFAGAVASATSARAVEAARPPIVQVTRGVA